MRFCCRPRSARSFASYLPVTAGVRVRQPDKEPLSGNTALPRGAEEVRQLREEEAEDIPEG